MSTRTYLFNALMLITAGQVLQNQLFFHCLNRIYIAIVLFLLPLWSIASSKDSPERFIETNMSIAGLPLSMFSNKGQLQFSLSYNHKNNGILIQGITPFIDRGRFYCDCQNYISDTGRSHYEYGIRLGYRKFLLNKLRSKLTVNTGATYLWGKIPYDVKRPHSGSGLYIVRDRGLILSTGLTYLKQVYKPLYITTGIDVGVRFINNKNKISIANSRTFTNLQVSIGLSYLINL